MYNKLLLLLILILVCSNSNAQMQSDSSDTVWSIVKPEAQSFNVDMKKVIVGSIKDSVIKSYITNTGSYKIRIDKIQFTGSNAGLFSLVSGMPPYTIDPGMSHSVEYRFKPIVVGVKIANIAIVTQADTIKQIISGEGILPTLNIQNNMIDFGKVYLNRIKDTIQVVTVKNSSKVPVIIKSVKIGYPNVKDFSILSNAGPFVVPASGVVTMDLRFKPSSLGRTSSTLLFELDGVDLPVIVQLFGEGYIVKPKITTNSPICEWDDLLIFVDSIPNSNFYWSGPNGFVSTQQNVIIKRAKSNQSGTYTVYAVVDGVITDTSMIEVSISSKNVSPGDSSLIFIGSAFKIGDEIKLTDAKVWDGGSVWLKNRFSVKNDFNTTFQFKVKKGSNNYNNNEDGSIPGADGIAFVMQNHNYPVLGELGGSIGYTGITNSLAVEYDLFKNFYDPNGNHIAVQSLGALPNSPDHQKNGSTIGINDKIITIEQDSSYIQF